MPGPPPTYGNPYGSPYGTPYGTPSWGPPAPWPVVTRSRPPGTVQAAVIVTWVCAGLSVLMTGFGLLAALFVGTLLFASFGGSDMAEMAVWFVVSTVVSLAATGLVCWFAWKTWQRSGWARYALGGMSLLVMVLAVLSFSLPGIAVFACAASVLLLLAMPSSTAWFRQAGPELPGPAGPPGS